MRSVANTPTTTANTVFEAILADIVGGKYVAGARLPAERELSRILGASRPTLREALQRLAEWGLIETRRGSGVVVRSREGWSIEVLPAYLRYAQPAANVQLLRDLLSMRRAIICEMVHTVAERIAPGALAEPRQAVERAWAAREQATFASEDFGVVRALVKAADFLPAMWLLNRISGIYLEIANSLGGPVIKPPADYLEVYGEFMNALEERDGARAAELIRTYLENSDNRVLSALEMFA